MRQSMTYAMATALALAVAAGPALAQSSTSTPPSTNTPTRTTTPESTSSTSKSSGADASFIKEAAAGGLAEVELGRLATQKAQSADVKQFGQHMVDDHSKANDQLKPIAQQKNIPIPTQLTGKEKSLYDRLSKLSGAEFDRAYMKAMLEDHRKDVAAFKKESTQGKDPDVKQFASSTLPTLENHLQMAQTTAGATATSGRSKTQTQGTSGTTPDHGGHDSSTPQSGSSPQTGGTPQTSPSGTSAPGR